MMLKTLLLTAALAVSPIVQADTVQDMYNTVNQLGQMLATQAKSAPPITRSNLQAQCVADAPNTLDKRVVNVLCECAMQYISASTNHDDRFVDFTLEPTEENATLIHQAIPVCINISDQVGADKFFEAFEQTKVGASDH